MGDLLFLCTGRCQHGKTMAGFRRVVTPKTTGSSAECEADMGALGDIILDMSGLVGGVGLNIALLVSQVILPIAVARAIDDGNPLCIGAFEKGCICQ